MLDSGFWIQDDPKLWIQNMVKNRHMQENILHFTSQILGLRTEQNKTRKSGSESMNIGHEQEHDESQRTS